MPSLIADKTTGLHLCIAVLGALYHRQATGEGQMIEVPMHETLASFWLTEHLFGATWQPPRGDMGYDRIINKFRHPFPTKDGYICALPYTDQHWITFFELAGRPDLTKEKKFVDRNERAKHFSELYQVLASLLEHRSTAEWLEMFDKADIPAMPVHTMEDLLEDPHLNATGFFTDREHPSEGPIKTFASPLAFEKTKVEYRHHAPRLGGDGVEVLREAGLSDAEIDELRSEKALIVPT